MNTRYTENRRSRYANSSRAAVEERYDFEKVTRDDIDDFAWRFACAARGFPLHFTLSL